MSTYMRGRANAVHERLTESKPDRGNSRALRVGGLAARGMGQRRSRPVAITPKTDVEQEIQMILREKGLAKDA